jgi:hypothetical protein
MNRTVVRGDPVMLKQLCPTAMAAMSLAVAVLIAAAPASAASAYRDRPPMHAGSCGHHSGDRDNWITSCRTYSYRDSARVYHYVTPRSEPVYPADAYPFHYEPPLGANGPYPGYEPYDGYESALGFFF